MPVLYLNDGQDIERLGLQATLAEMFANGLLQPFVLVGIHASEARQQEYGTAAQADYLGRGSMAAAYTRFVLEELLPFVQLHYKVSANSTEAVFAGFSLGGLSAFDLVWHHPAAFARAGAFSGSFWWRSKALDAGYTSADRIMHGLVKAGTLHPLHRFWLQTGTLDEQSDRDGNGVIDSIDDCLDLIEALAGQGLDLSQRLRYVQAEGGRHHPDTWGKVMPDFLLWAFGATAAALPTPIPMVRLQLTPAQPLPEEALISTGAAMAAEESGAQNDSTDEPLPLTPEPAHRMQLARPVEGDFLPYYEKYISLVPEDADPRLMLREQTAEVEAALGALSEEQAQLAYAEGKWTVKQFLLHQIDTERIFAYRALRFARGDSQTLAGFDENEYAENSGANERSMSNLLAEYRATRAATLALLESFTDEQLLRSGTANGARVTVNALLYILPGHERHHLNIFQERYLPVLGVR
ncbi:hypothetical protein GCM10023185_18830 [Hymenobacter saemangeumensis]|uniref:DinB-like domain-containing protein n=1 Tax=Hymenobacter saemangeumensis TaxID=1084522 RepID=A0ABP8ICE4_9BACT